MTGRVNDIRLIPFPIDRGEESLIIPDKRVAAQATLRPHRALVDDLLRRDRHLLQRELILGPARQAGQVDLARVLAGVEFPLVGDLVRPLLDDGRWLAAVVEDLLDPPRVDAVARDDFLDGFVAKPGGDRAPGAFLRGPAMGFDGLDGGLVHRKVPRVVVEY